MLSIYTLVLWKFFSSFQITPIYVDCSSVLGNIHCVSKTSHLGSPEMQDAKNRQKSPSGHHCTNLSGHICATKAHIDNWKKTC